MQEVGFEPNIIWHLKQKIKEVVPMKALNKLPEKYYLAYNAFFSRETEKPFFVTTSSLGYALFKESRVCFVFRTIHKVKDPENNKERYHVFSLDFCDDNNSFNINNHQSFAKKIDSRNYFHKLQHNIRWENVEEPPVYEPLFERKKISPEAMEVLRERGKRLNEKRYFECPLCLDINIPVKNDSIAICKKCNGSYVFQA